MPDGAKPVAAEGDPCPEACGGQLELLPDGPCTCLASPRPPCHACESWVLQCDSCSERPA